MKKILRRAINSVIITAIVLGSYALGKISDSSSVLWMFGIGFLAILYFQDNDFFVDYPGRKVDNQMPESTPC